MFASLIFRLPLAAAMVMACAALSPLSAQAPEHAPPPETVAPNDPFGEPVELTAKPIVYLESSGLWLSAFETIIDAFKSVSAALDKQGIKPDGALMAIYTATDETGFQFWAAAPVAQAPAEPLGGDIKVGTSPIGKALKFVHRGSYESMDITYEAITNYLDDRFLDAQDLFIEQYMKDPVTTPEDDLVIEVYVPLK
jgi:effector-binding domain-containing protein